MADLGQRSCVHSFMMHSERTSGSYDLIQHLHGNAGNDMGPR